MTGWALVTGASRGIGRAAAVRLARRGLGLGLPARPSAALEDSLRELEAQGVTVEVVPADLADARQVVTAARELERRLGPPDVLLNNAGVVHREPVANTSLEHLDEQLAVNLRAPYLLVRELLPGMLAAGRGRIVNVGSISSTIGSPGAAAYCATKWALLGFTRSLAAEVADRGVVVCCLLPGSTDTDMLQGSGFAPRMTADDVARTLEWLALDAPPSHHGAAVEQFGR